MSAGYLGPRDFKALLSSLPLPFQPQFQTGVPHRNKMVPLSHLSRDWNADGGEGSTSTPQSASLRAGSSKPPRGSAQHSVSKTGSISKIIRPASRRSTGLFFMAGEIRWLFRSLPFIDQSLLFSHIPKLPTVCSSPPILNSKSLPSPTGQIRRPRGNHLDVTGEVLLSPRRKETESPLSVVCSRPAGIVFLCAID